MLGCFSYIALLWKICNKISLTVWILFNSVLPGILLALAQIKLTFSFKLIWPISELICLLRCFKFNPLIIPDSFRIKEVASMYKWNTTVTQTRGTFFATPKPHSHALNDVIMHKTTAQKYSNSNSYLLS